MEKLSVLRMDEDDLISLLRKVIREEIQNLLNEFHSQTKDDVLLDRNEVCDFLKISKATLHNYQKSDRIPYYKIGRKVFFKKNEILKAIEIDWKLGRRKN